MGLAVGMVIRLNVTVPIIANQVEALKARIFTASLEDSFGGLPVNPQVSIVAGGGVQYGVTADAGITCHIAGSTTGVMDHEGKSMCDLPFGYKMGDVFYSKYFYVGTAAQSFNAIKNLALTAARSNATFFCAGNRGVFKESKSKALKEREMKEGGMPNSSYVKVYGTCTPDGNSSTSGTLKNDTLYKPSKNTASPSAPKR